MKIIVVTSVLVVLFHWIGFPVGAVIVIIGTIKGLTSGNYKKTFNIDMKLNRLYKNDMYELASVIIIVAFMYDGFHPSAFEQPLDLPMTFIQIFVLFFLLFRGMEEKLFEKEDL